MGILGGVGARGCCKIYHLWEEENGQQGKYMAAGGKRIKERSWGKYQEKKLFVEGKKIIPQKVYKKLNF